MKLFAYGCSYTKGSELADDFLTGLSVQETEKIKKQTGNAGFNKKYLTNVKYKAYNDLMHERSYASFIAKKCKLEYVNRAISGSSNLSMYYEILKDIDSGLIKKEDIVFVGFTSLNRYSWFKDSKLETGHPSGTSWPADKFKKQFITYTSDSDYILHSISHIHAIFEICKDYKFYYQTTHWPYSQTYSNTEINNPLWNQLEIIDKGAIIPFHCLFYELEDPEKYQLYSHSFGHPYKEFHESFGNKLGEAIYEKI